MQIKKMDLMENKRINSNSYVHPTQNSNRTMAKFHQNMASADDNSGIPPVPALPPMGKTGGHMSKDEFPTIFLGQNSPPGAVAGRKDTPRMMMMAYCAVAGAKDIHHSITSICDTEPRRWRMGWRGRTGVEISNNQHAQGGMQDARGGMGEGSAE